MTFRPRDPSSWLPEFETFAAAFFEEHEVPGGAATVVSGDEVLSCRGFGLRDREAALPVTDTTRFGIASLSKSFAALTVLSLVAEGRLSLEDPVTRWLPGFGYPGLRDEAPVRIRHMLSHTSGIPPLRALDYAIHPSQIGDPAEAYTERSYDDAPQVQDYEELLAYLRRGEGPLIADPGALVSYSNDAYGLVGAVVEAVTGRPFPSVVRERVFAPLGMDGASFETADPRVAGALTVPYTCVADGEVIASPQWERAPAHAATGFMQASARDLSRSLRWLIGGGGDPLGIPRELLAEALAPHGWAEPGTQYGLGWMLGPRRRSGGAVDAAQDGAGGDAAGDAGGVTLIRHGGSLKGVSSHQGFVPELGLGVAVLANLDEVPVKRLWLAAVNLALGLEPDAPLFDPPEGVRGAGAGVLGRFVSGEPWGRFEVRQEDGVLQAYSGDDLSHAGRLAWLNEREFVLVSEAGAWAGGRVHVGESGAVHAVQQGMRWYVREAVAEETPASPGASA